MVLGEDERKMTPQSLNHFLGSRKVGDSEALTSGFRADNSSGETSTGDRRQKRTEESFPTVGCRSSVGGRKDELLPNILSEP